ncbi:Ig-like domain-containing protein [Miltoncostaea marina]|uniref:Ig-like domain-containing protein n=1 Tax=Miltoncostaea marina TaxID=2843215 RepID=UPI001C3C73CD|nr:Ig-like domain-containing protein [Miltoncostaea marina]
MRIARRLVPSLILLLVLAGTAVGAPRSGTLLDPAGDVGSADGYSRPDAAQLTIAHDPDTGRLTTQVRFHQPVPVVQNGRHTEFVVVLNTGSASAAGYCDWGRGSDLEVRIEVVRGPSGDSVRQVTTNRLPRTDYDDRGVGFFNLAGDLLTVTVERPELAGRLVTCVSPTRVTYGALPGADEIAGFFFDGFQPPPPAPDEVRPSVRWSAPAGGAVISGVYSEVASNGAKRCEVVASDNVRVNRVEIFVDDVLHEIQRFAPWGCELDTRKLTEGQHTLRAEAFDEANNRAVASITVTVRNTGAPPPPPPPPVEIPIDIVPVTPRDPAPTPAVPAVPVTGAPPAPPVVPVISSRLEPFVRCRVVRSMVRWCRVKPGAFLSVRVTGGDGRLRKDVSGRVRVQITCSPRRACADGRTIRLRTAAPKLKTLLGRRPLAVGTRIDFRITRPGAIGSYHRLKITRNGPATKTCELVGTRIRACG